MLDYDALAADYARHRRIHPEVFQQLLTVSGIGQHAAVLEVGCGTGNYIGAIRRHTGCSCRGIDPSEGMLERARQQAHGVALTQGRAEELPFPGAVFDLIFSVDVIHHVIDRAAYYREAFRTLKPGGHICTVTDSEWVIRHRKPLSYYFPDTVPVELKRYPSMESLRTFMLEAGFRTVEELLVEFPYQLTDVQPYRDRAFSSLHLIGREALAAGLARMEADLAAGPIPCVSYYTMLWGSK